MAEYRRLEGDITPEDIAYAHAQDKWACAFVRAIQRVFPEATHVQVEREHTRLSVKSDGFRYEFETPRNVVEDVIRPLDIGGTPRPTHFVLDAAVARWPLEKKTEEQLTKRRARLSPNERTRPRRITTRNPNVRAVGRFTVEQEAAE